MHFREVKLIQWRNLPRLELSLRPGVTMVIGDNAQGKTNFLEALYIIARRTSPRRAKEADLIRWGEEKGYCGVRVIDDSLTFTRELLLRAGKRKEWKWNGCPEPRRGERNTIWLVGFFPHEVEIIDGTPQLRRDFLDQAAGFVYPAHEILVSRYSKALFRRNVLLKERAAQDLIAAYTDQMVDIGEKIIQGRLQYLKFLLPHLSAVYCRLAGGNAKVEVEYEPARWQGTEDIGQRLRNAFDRCEREERERGMTLVGPHRDNLAFLNQGKEFKQFASQGEKKTLALALKMAEMRVMKELKRRDVIVLLDDVFSELDKNRRRYLFQELFGGGQIIFSTTGVMVDEEMAGKRLTRLTCQGGSLKEDG